MKPIFTLAIVGLLSVLASCAALMEPTHGAGLEVEIRPTHLLLTNHTKATIYYFAIEGELATRTLWGPCTDPLECSGVAAGQRIELGYDDVAGYEAGREQDVLLYWWHLVPSSEGGFRPDSIRTIRVQP